MASDGNWDGDLRLSRRGVLRAIGLGTAAAAGLGACAKKDPGGAGASSGPVAGSITVWSWQNPAAALKALIPAFHQVYPNVQVNVQDVGNPAIWDKITTVM